MNNKLKKRKINYNINKKALVVLFISLLFVGVGYAHIITTLGIDGNVSFSQEIIEKSEVFNESTGWGYKDENLNGSLDIGEEVYKGTEYFYAIDNTGNNVTLLSKFNLKVENGEIKSVQANVKDYTYYAVAFAKKSYWPSFCNYTYTCNINNIDDSTNATVINIARAYAKSLSVDATGRLLTKEEVQKLSPGANSTNGSIKGEYAYIINGTYASEGSLRYWLGTAENDGGIARISGGAAYIGTSGYTIYEYFGVRPVLEVPKSKIL